MEPQTTTLPTTTRETPFEQFARLYGAEGRGLLLWGQWMEVLPEMNRNAMERIAQDQSEAHGLPLEEIQARLALQKFLEDNPGFLDSFLKEQFVQSRALRPMSLNQSKKKKK
jgi:hypothetical protein